MKINHIFNSQANTVHRAAGILIISALVSRILAVARDWLLAKNFGAGPDLDVYFAVFRIPDFIYHILISGGVVVAFLPLFSEFFSRNKEDAWKFANNVLNVFLFFLFIFSLTLFIFTPFIVKLITPGFSEAQIEQTIFLTRLMFLSPILFGLSSIFSGILQHFHRFLAYSLAPIFYNLGIISGIVFLSPEFGVTGIIIGVLGGAFLHLFIQLPPALNCGFKYRPIFNLKAEGLKQIFLLMLPRTLGVASSQINLIIITSIASTLAAGSISIFNLTQNIQNLPVGIIGVSFAIAVFVPMTKNLTNGAKGAFLKDFSSTIRQVIYIIFPSTFLLFILRNQVIESILGYGEFDKVSAQLAAASLGLFCLGLWAIALIPLISRAFFALKDTRTPAIIVFLTVALNIVLSFYFIGLLNADNFVKEAFKNFFQLGMADIRVLALPLAFAVSGIFQVAALSILIYRKIGNFHLGEIWNSVLKIIIATLFSGAAAYFSSRFLFGKIGHPVIYLELAVGAAAGIIVYFFATHFLKSPEAQALKSRLTKK